MRKKLSIILVITLMLTFTACGQQHIDSSIQKDQPVNTEEPDREVKDLCVQEGCGEFTVDSELSYCQNHIGICGLCEDFIRPGTEYCNQCTYDMGLPVDDPDFVPDGSRFTNRYGSPSTICAHTGCKNKIASSGDTNCCQNHSNRCGNCDCYIDEDALFCMECIEDALG